jgi:hypothetical protein
MRFFAALLALGLLISGAQVAAQPATPQSAAQPDMMMPQFLVLAQAGAERMVREVPVGLTNAQIWGIAVGVVTGAFVADLAGLNGLATLALAAAGGATGNMLLSPAAVAEVAEELDDDDL